MNWTTWATRLDLKCGGCGSELHTSTVTMKEREDVVNQWNISHAPCWEQSDADEETSSAP